MESAAAALRSVLAAEPRAWVAAIGPDGLFVPIPESLAVRETHRLLQGRWALDHVSAADRGPLAATWRELTAVGEGHASRKVHLITGGMAMFHVFKVAAEVGADVVVAITDDDDADLGAAPTDQDLITSSRFARVLRDQAGRAIEVDSNAPQVLGWSAEVLLNREPPLQRAHPEDRDALLHNWMATLGEPGTGHRSRVRLLRDDGTYRWFEVTNFNRLDDPDKPCVVTELLDISDEMAAHEAVRAREQLLRRLAEALPLGVLQLDVDRRILYRNDYLRTVLGAADATTLAGQFAGVVVEDLPALEGAFAAALDEGEDDDVVIRIRRGRHRSERLVRLITKSLLSESGEPIGVIACISDVTEAEMEGRELARRATYDALTGCLNRPSIVGYLEDALAAGPGAATIFLDLDGLKDANDRFGHAVGDEMLKATASVLGAMTRRHDAVGRLGGDEFLVVCSDVASEDVAMELAGRISAVIECHPAIGEADVPLKASIGVAWAPSGAVSAEELLRRSDAAMYEAKREAARRPRLWVP